MTAQAWAITRSIGQRWLSCRVMPPVRLIHDAGGLAVPSISVELIAGSGSIARLPKKFRPMKTEPWDRGATVDEHVDRGPALPCEPPLLSPCTPLQHGDRRIDFRYRRCRQARRRAAVHVRGEGVDEFRSSGPPRARRSHWRSVSTGEDRRQCVRRYLRLVVVGLRFLRRGYATKPGARQAWTWRSSADYADLRRCRRHGTCGVLCGGNAHRSWWTRKVASTCQPGAAAAGQVARPMHEHAFQHSADP